MGAVDVDVVRAVGEARVWIAAPRSARLRVLQVGPPVSLREGDDASHSDWSPIRKDRLIMAVFFVSIPPDRPRTLVFSLGQSEGIVRA